MNDLEAIKMLFKFSLEQEETYLGKVTEIVKLLTVSSFAVLAIVASISGKQSPDTTLQYPWLLQTSLILLLVSPCTGVFYLYSLAIPHKLAQKKILDELESKGAAQVYKEQERLGVPRNTLHRLMFPLCWLTFFLSLLTLAVHSVINIQP